MAVRAGLLAGAQHLHEAPMVCITGPPVCGLT